MMRGAQLGHLQHRRLIGEKIAASAVSSKCIHSE
jgi:hypothetical protein